MSGVRVEVRIDGLGGLNAALARMAMLGERPRPIWEAIAQYGESSTRLRFKHQRGPDGARWKPSQRAQLSGGQTLVERARLLRSISSTADNSGAAWGTNVIYAAIHQFGGPIKAKAGGALRFRLPSGGYVTTKRVTMLARPFLGVNDEDGREMLALANDVIAQAARPRGEE